MESVPSLEGLPSAARAALVERAREVRFRPRERILSLFSPSPRILFLLEGMAKLSCVTANGLERIVYAFRPGEVMGARFLGETPESTCEIVAISPVRTAAIPLPDFLAIAESHPEILIAVTAGFTARLSRMTDRVMEAMTAEVPVRIADALLDFVADGDGGGDGDGRRRGFVPLLHPVTHAALGQMVGASRPHVSASLGALEAAGAVRRIAPRGLLVHPALLRSIVERGEMGPDGDGRRDG